MASGSAQRLSCEPRQAGNGATAAISACVAVKSEAAQFLELLIIHCALLIVYQ